MMKKKTAFIGGFLLLLLLLGGGATGFIYYQARQFQHTIQSWAGESGLELGHLRLGLGDLEQGDSFPVSTGQFRVSVLNRCNAEVLDVGVVKYTMGQVPFFYEHGNFQWFPADSDDTDPLLTVTTLRKANSVDVSLQPSPWMSTFALAPALKLQVGSRQIELDMAAQLIKLAAVTEQPDDLLARQVSLKLKWDTRDALNSELHVHADQISSDTHNVKDLDMRVIAESDDTDQIQWVLSAETGALKWGDVLLDKTKTDTSLFVGHSPSLQFLLQSAMQSCGGFATAKSHEFNVQSAYNLLIQKGLRLQHTLTGEINAAPVVWDTRISLNPQLDFNTGLIHLGRSIDITNQLTIPFDKFGKKQLAQAMETGLFTARELKGPYDSKTTRNASLLQRQLAAMDSASGQRGTTLAGLWANDLKRWLNDAEQSLYLKEFALAPNVSITPRVNFEGLDGVRVDAQGGVRKLLKTP
ncbi:hypothetical protein NQT62_13875 [Limnobacter humi]|uniref:DUF945 family protein n=1 Tax=Limnobacter humi TaxID=1778671 RepID=A0ABT1WJ30_9BURK|nr:hypothetical protein [Limnobacter humi]MCQ8897525.1 hypothetical protein [Limnobacter humi]